MPRPHARALAVLLLAHGALAAGCRGTSVQGLEVAGDPVHGFALVTRLHDGRSYSRYAFAHGTPASWQREPVVLGYDEPYYNGPLPYNRYQLAATADGRVFLAARLLEGFALWSRAGDAWRAVDVAPGINVSTTGVLLRYRDGSESDVMTWSTRAGAVRVLTTARLFEVEGTRLVRALDVTPGGVPDRGPVGQTADGQAVVLGLDGSNQLFRLACGATACSWTADAQPALGDCASCADPARPMVFFVTAGGAPVLVYGDPAANAVVRWRGGSAQFAGLLESAAARVGEGAVLLLNGAPGDAPDHRTGTADVVVLDAAFAPRRITLGPYFPGAARVLLATNAAGGEEAHVFGLLDGANVAHFTVNLADGALTSESFRIRN